MKSCLKTPSLPPTPDQHCCQRKCVAFCAEGSEQVFPADDWDRTPAEPTQKLTYSDILELKEIQRSLPTAPQTPDPLCKHQWQLLDKVPISLLPLLPETYSCKDTSPPPISPPPPTSTVTAPPYSMTFKARPQISPWRPMSNPQTNSPNHSRPRPQFAFLPLLDSSPAANQSTVDSPPSSPRTFAEFEASLELGNDKVLHHHAPAPFPNAFLDKPPSEALPHRDPFDPFRASTNATSSSAETPLIMARGDSYFPPFPAPSSPPLNPGGNERTGQESHPEPKLPNLLSSPSTGSPSPRSLAPSPPPQFAGGKPQTNMQLNGSTPGRTSRMPLLVLGVEVAREDIGLNGWNSRPLSPGPKYPSSKQSSPPPLTQRTSPPLQPRWKPASENITPYFAFERAGGFSSRTQSSPPPPPPSSARVTSPSRTRDFQPPSPILAPYCAPMRARSSACSSPVIAPLNKGRRAGVGI